MQNKIDKLLEDDETQHSGFQIEHFIIGKQGDRWARYKQCLREIRSRAGILAGLEDDAALSVLGMKKKRSFRFLAIFTKKINMGLAEKQYRGIINNIKETERELVCFLEIAEKLKNELGEITDERRYQLETESWKNKGIKMAAIDILATGRISNQTYDFIFSLPKESQLELFAKLSNQQPMALLGFEPDEIKAITRK